MTFEPGDVAHHHLAPPGVADITVQGVGVCGDVGCAEPTVLFADPQSGEPDEIHASDLRLNRAQPEGAKA